MGILLSVLQSLGTIVLQSLGTETGENENAISSHNFKSHEKSECDNLVASPHQRQMKYSTVSAPELRGSSSLAHTSVNNKVINSPKACGGETAIGAQVPVVDKCTAAAVRLKEVEREEEREIKHHSNKLPASSSSRGQENYSAAARNEIDHDAVVSSIVASPHQRQMKYSTVSVPELRGSSSLARTSVNDKVINSPKACGGETAIGAQVPLVDKCTAAAVRLKEVEREEEREIKHHSNKLPASSSSRGQENYTAAARYEIDLDAVVSSIVARYLESLQEIFPSTQEEEEERRRRRRRRRRRGRREEEEEEEEVQRESGVGELRKIKHYSNRHRILLVGEGDFSFSACLAVAFGSATNIIATSLNKKAFLKKNYGSAMSNIAEIRSRGGKVMYRIDATKIAKHKLLRQLQFDRIVFNFPFAGFFPYLSPECRLRCHRRLVSLFLKNAKEMLSENGEIHISNKTTGVNAKFNVESIASSHGLRLIAAVKFKCSNYPGYNTKSGFGGDENFNCNPSKTFKFCLKT